jgi:para-nitrobenzyl esterase
MSVTAFLVAALIAGPALRPTPVAAAQATSSASPVTVTVGNFIRAETDFYFKTRTFGKLSHNRTMAAIDKQDVVRMNRDTLYSSGVFDLDAAPVTITLPDAGKRFMSMQVVSEDHYTTEVVYGPGRFTYTKDKIGTRYVFLLVRTLANPEDAADMKAANAVQDSIKVEQANVGTFEVPNWDSQSQAKVRNALNALAPLRGSDTGVMFGTRNEVDPIGTAIGWGGNPPSAAKYPSFYPKNNSGKTIHKLTLKDVPVDGFWSISVYNAKGFFEKNSLNAYSLNNVTAKPNADGLVHDPVWRLPERHAKLPPDHERLELHRAALSPARRNPQQHMETSEGAGDELAPGKSALVHGRTASFFETNFADWHECEVLKHDPNVWCQR